MTDSHYPTIDPDFFHECCVNSEKFHASITVGNSTGYILKGTKPIAKRTITIRKLRDGHIGFDIATSTAYRMNFLGPLLKWLEEHRNWKDGGYVD
jgi:hypothetical protein